MNVSEYNTIRNEMLQRSKTAEHLPFFAISAIALLISWLTTQAPSAGFTFDDPFFFVLIGEIIVSFTFIRYQLIIKSIYDRGSYLVAFYELSKVELPKENSTEKYDLNLEISVDNQDSPKWHTLNRVQQIIFSKSKFPVKWGRKTALMLFPFLIFSVWFAPLYIMWEDVSLINQIQFLLFITCLFISIVSFIYIMGNFLTMDNFMLKSMSKWVVFREFIKRKPNIIITEKFRKYIKKYQKVFEPSE